MKLSGSVCIITGSATGVGAACAVMLAGKGARVVINYSRSEREARETMVACMAAGNEALLVQGDVANDADCRRIADAALERWGRIDGLVNNAGITKFANPADLDLLEAADFHRLLDVNVIGAFQMIRAARALLEVAPQPGAVVNTASVAGVLGIGSSVPYAASKGALVTMTLSLARALAPKIRVNAICPGFIDTPWFGRSMDAGALERMRAGVAASMPLKAASTAEDIAGAAVFLASPAARHITGETLLTDAGLHLGYAPLGMR